MCIRVGVAQLPEVVLGQVLCAFESVFESVVRVRRDDWK